MDFDPYCEGICLRYQMNTTWTKMKKVRLQYRREKWSRGLWIILNTISIQEEVEY